MVRHPLAASLMALLALAAPAARAETVSDIADICRHSGALAAQEVGVPNAVMQAITLTETGRPLQGRFQPWPWTVNMEGVGKWFATRDQALAYAEQHYRRGARSFDIGCFQINYRWHGQNFTSIAQMFEPQANARYAAMYLRDLYAEKGTWSAAAGRYHSATPKFASRYRARFDQILARLTGATPPPPVQMAEAEPEVPPPPPWVPPPPTRFGSVAAIDALPGAQPLLILPTRRLY